MQCGGIASSAAESVMSTFWIYWREKSKRSNLGWGGGEEGLTKHWQLFKFTALSGEYNSLSIAWDTALRPSRRQT